MYETNLMTNKFRIADRLSSLVLKQEGDQSPQVGIAGTLDDLKAAYQLVYQEYYIRGYCDADDSRMHFSFYCFLPSSRTFILEREGKVLGTLSLIIDSSYGLPAEAEFADEIQAVRSPTRKVAEISLLAIDRSLYEKEDPHLAGFRKLGAAFFLFKGMFDYVRLTGITDFVIAVHPKQESLYQSLTFKRIGSERLYRPACGNPAIAMHANIQRWFEMTPEEQRVRAYLLGKASGNCWENCFEWNAGVIRELLRGKSISSAAREHLQVHYPDLT